MQTAIIVQGRLVGPTTIELDEPVSQATSAVEVFVRLTAAAQPQPAGPSLLELIDSLPPGTRTKESIDAQLEEERNFWEPKEEDLLEGGPNLLEIIDSFPPRSRSTEELDAELNAERNSWK